MPLIHRFTSPVPDNGEPDEVGPDEWNEPHDVDASDILIGRASAGPGAAENIPCTAAGRALLAAATPADQRDALELGTAATANAGDFDAAGSADDVASDLAAHAASSTAHGISAFGATLVSSANPAAARTALGLAAVAATGNAADLSGVVRTPYAPGSLTIATGHFAVFLRELRLEASDRLTLQGDSRIAILTN